MYDTEGLAGGAFWLWRGWTWVEVWGGGRTNRTQGGRYEQGKRFARLVKSQL